MNWADHILTLHRMSGLRRFQFSQRVTVIHSFATDASHFWRLERPYPTAPININHQRLTWWFGEHLDLELLGAHLS